MLCVVGLCISSLLHFFRYLKTPRKANVYHCSVVLTLTHSKLLFLLKIPRLISEVEDSKLKQRNQRLFWSIALHFIDASFLAIIQIRYFLDTDINDYVQQHYPI